MNSACRFSSHICSAVLQHCEHTGFLDATNGTSFASMCILEPFIEMTFPTMEAEKYPT